jgi:hypothetical protein
MPKYALVVKWLRGQKKRGAGGDLKREANRLSRYLAAAKGSNLRSGGYRFEANKMMLSLFAKYGTSNELALAANREPLGRDWSLRQEDAVDSKKLMLNQQSALQRDGFILGTHG